MRSYTVEQLRDALAAAGIRKGATLLVHSSLLHLGKFEGVPSAEISERVFEELRIAVGDEGTIVVPTFTFAFCRGQTFDRQASASEGMGAFSEYVRARHDACRSPHPMQPVSAVGAKAALICAGDTASSFDDGGPFDTLLGLDADVLLLGATMQAMSLIHYAEERANVPYRYWKSFTGTWKDGDEAEQRSYRMFVRDLDRDPRLKLARLGDELDSCGELRRAALGAGWLSAFKATAFVRLATAALLTDPWAFVEN